MAGKKGMRKYSLETKLEAVRLFLEKHLTRAEVAELLGLTSGENVKEWVKIYRHEGPEGLSKGKPGRQKHKETMEEELKRLRMEITLLKKFHSELQASMLAKRNIGSSSDIKNNSK
jgi:transposase-like protein